MSKSWIKWSVRLGLWIWFAYWIAQIFVGDLGASPALTLNHELGHMTLIVLSMNLVLGAALDIFKPAPKSIRFWLSERRFWGVTSFVFLSAHVLFYFVNEGFEAKAWTQLYTKTYLIFGTLSFFVFFLLATTSNNLSVRRLGGKRWKQLHRFIYLVQLLLLGHILAIEKADLKLYAPWLFLLIFMQVIRWIRRRLYPV